MNSLIATSGSPPGAPECADASAGNRAAIVTSRTPSLTASSYALAGVVFVVAVLVAYLPALTAPFVMDDEGSIAANPSIRTLWPLSAPLSPPRGGGLTVEGRPILNFTLALNYAFAGTSASAYRLTNIAIHIATGLLLFGIVRRTLLIVRVRSGGEAEAQPGFLCRATLRAFVLASLWTLHPLQTESVTYVIQRAESLCGFFYLLTLYGFIRGAEPPSIVSSSPPSPSRFGWWSLSVAACLLGMGTKEVMVSAPLMIFLYDRTFLAGNFAAAWRYRSGIHLGLASTWLVLVWLVPGLEGRGGSAGFHAGISSWHYVLTQCEALARYVQLALWPYPLVFDYGTTLVTRASDVALPALAIIFALVATALALWRHPKLGFLGAWFFALLAPSSSFVPVATQTMAEHRMYLPLVALVVLTGWAGHVMLGRRALPIGAAAALVATIASAERNSIYRDPLALWHDTVAHRPDNTRARNNLALLLRERGRSDDALAHLQAALLHEPTSLALRNNLANVLLDLDRPAAALAEIDAVLRAAPGLAEAYDTKADILRAMQQPDAAAANRAHALRLKPDLATAAGP